MASPSYGSGRVGPRPPAAGLPPTALLGVAALGVIGFALHLAPVYRGRSADVLAAQPLATWVGAGGLALLLAGLLAVPARHPDRGPLREVVAVVSVFGTLTVLAGLIDLPTGAEIGWALIVITVLAVAQSALALAAALQAAPLRSPEPTSAADHFDQRPTGPIQPVSPGPSYAPPAAPPVSYGRGTGTATNQASAQGSEHAGQQSQYTAPPWVEAPRHVGPADQPTTQMFTPQPLSAPSGAQPAGSAAAGAPQGAWGGRAQPATEQRGAGAGPSTEGFTPGQQ